MPRVSWPTKKPSLQSLKKGYTRYKDTKFNVKLLDIKYLSVKIQAMDIKVSNFADVAGDSTYGQMQSN